MNDVSFDDKVRQKLASALAPNLLELTDESARHQGHAGYRPGGNGHFRLLIVSTRFTGLNRVARHRLIHDLLAIELRDQIHALAITALTPQEWEVRSKE